MNKRIHLLYGLLIGIAICWIGMYLYVTLALQADFVQGVKIVNQQGNLGKLIALGSIPNLIIFFLLLKKKREMLARGIVLATIIIAISTIFYL